MVYFFHWTERNLNQENSNAPPFLLKRDPLLLRHRSVLYVIEKNLVDEKLTFFVAPRYYHQKFGF